MLKNTLPSEHTFQATESRCVSRVRTALTSAVNRVGFVLITPRADRVFRHVSFFGSQVALGVGFLLSRKRVSSSLRCFKILQRKHSNRITKQQTCLDKEPGVVNGLHRRRRLFFVKLGSFILSYANLGADISSTNHSVAGHSSSSRTRERYNPAGVLPASS